MTSQDIIDSICGTKTQDPVLVEIAHQLEGYTRQFQTGELSNEEYQELVADLQVEIGRAHV